jgi:integrase
MAIRKRGSSWEIDYYEGGRDGRRVRKTFDKRKDAEAELGKRVSLIAEGRYLDIKKEYRTTLDKVLDKYETNYNHQASYKTAKRFFVARIRRHFGSGRVMSSIQYVDLEEFRAKLMARPATVLMRDGREVVKGRRSNAAINREMSCLRHIFKKAKSWKLIEHNPFTDGDTFVLKENNLQLRYLPEEEAERLIDACRDHLRPIVVFCLYTGARHGEAVSLKWHQVSGGFVHFDKTKTDESRVVPLNPAVIDMLEAMRPVKGDGKVVDLDGRPVPLEAAGGHVFLFKGKPLQDVDIAFKGACARAGIPFGRRVPGGVTFHTLRHTFASWLAIAGVPIKTIQELLGHKNIAMTMRYAHLSENVKRDAVGMLPGLGSVSRSHNVVANKGRTKKAEEPNRL